MGGDVKASKNGHDLIAGGAAGAIARFVVAPLDVVKIRFQVQLEPIAGASAARSHYTGVLQAMATIMREEGLVGLWRGTVPAQLLYVPYTAIQFAALRQAKDLAARLGFGGGKDAPLPAAVSFAAGAVAGVAATLGSYPFDLLRTMLAAQGEPRAYRNLVDAAMHVTRTRGPAGLFAGIGATLVEIVPYAALQFGLYDLFTAAAVDYREQRCRGASTAGPGAVAAERFGCGLAAGLLAKMAIHPLDVAKKRFQVAGLPRHPRYGAGIEAGAYRSLGHCLATIAKQEGVRGLYKGAWPSVLKAAPAAAITFSVYELVSRWLESMDRSDAS